MQLLPDNYSGPQLAEAMKTALGAGYDVSFTRRGTLLFSLPPGETLRLVTPAQLRDPAFHAAWTGTPYSLTDPRDASVLLASGDFSAAYEARVSLAPYDVLYLHSSLTTYDGMDAVGRTGILARIPIDRPFGGIVHYQQQLDEGWIDASGISFRNLRLSLRDADYNLVDLKGGHLSLHLIFE